MQKTEWLNTKNIIVLLLGVVAMYLIVTSLVDNRFKEIELNTRLQIAEQEVSLATISEITARNGADSITESIVLDCSISERSKFDDLLSRLDQRLNRTELVELERLFGRCGGFYSERKSLMVSRLAREIEVYENYVNQLSVIIDEDLSKEFFVTEWKSLAAEESKQGELFSKLVQLQDEIISTLIDGKGADSEEIVSILQQVGEVQETLLITRKQATSIRSGLVSI